MRQIADVSVVHISTPEIVRLHKGLSVQGRRMQMQECWTRTVWWIIPSYGVNQWFEDTTSKRTIDLAHYRGMPYRNQQASWPTPEIKPWWVWSTIHGQQHHERSPGIHQQVEDHFKELGQQAAQSFQVVSGQQGYYRSRCAVSVSNLAEANINCDENLGPILSNPCSIPTWPNNPSVCVPPISLLRQLLWI